MLKSLGARIGVIHGCYLALLFLVVGATAVVLHQKADDSMVVNLSGRQRMLTQRITHQLLGFAAEKELGENTDQQRQQVLGSMRVFETTLQALRFGGPAPMDLEMVNFREAPPASPAVRAQLNKVHALYLPYEKAARSILQGEAQAEQAGVAYIIAHNTELLSEMNLGVNMMQSEAEKRIYVLYFVQGGALAAGLLLSILLSLLTRRSVVDPLRALNQASDAMSRGDVHRSIAATGPREIHELGSSFERLRVAMKNLIESDTGVPSGGL